VLPHTTGLLATAPALIAVTLLTTVGVVGLMVVVLVMELFVVVVHAVKHAQRLMLKMEHLVVTRIRMENGGGYHEAR
jgi:hypothetical protein